MTTNRIEFELTLDDQLSGALSKVTLFYFLEKARKMAQDFEEQMANANSIFLENMSNYQRLTQQVVDLGGKTTKSLTDIATSLYNLASAGLSAKDSFKVLEESVRFAEGTGADIDKITEAVTKFSRSFKISFSQSGQVVEQFANAINLTQLKFEDLHKAMKFMTQIGSLFPKQSLDEMLTALGMLVNRGIPASSAMRHLRSVMIDLSKESGKLTKFLNKYGLTLKDVSLENNKLIDVIAKFKRIGVSTQEVMKLFGKRASGVFKILMDEGVEAFENLNQEIKNNMSLSKQIEAQHESLGKKLKLLGTAMQSVFIDAFSWLNDMIKGFADFTLQILNAVKSLGVFKDILAGIGLVGFTSGLITIVKQLGIMTTNMLGLSKATEFFKSISVPALTAVAIGVGGLITIYEKYKQTILEINKLQEEAREKEATQLGKLIALEKLYIKTADEENLLKIKIRIASLRQGNALLQKNWKLYQELAVQIEKYKKELKEITQTEKEEKQTISELNQETLTLAQRKILLGGSIDELNKKLEDYRIVWKYVRQQLRDGKLDTKEAAVELMNLKLQYHKLWDEVRKQEVVALLSKGVISFEEAIKKTFNILKPELSTSVDWFNKLNSAINKAFDKRRVDEYNKKLKDYINNEKVINYYAKLWNVTNEEAKNILKEVYEQMDTGSKKAIENQKQVNQKSDEFIEKLKEMSKYYRHNYDSAKDYASILGDVFAIDPIKEQIYKMQSLMKNYDAVTKIAEYFGLTNEEVIDKIKKKIDELNGKLHDTRSVFDRALDDLAEKYNMATDSVDQYAKVVKDAFDSNLIRLQKEREAIQNLINDHDKIKLIAEKLGLSEKEVIEKLMKLWTDLGVKIDEHNDKLKKSKNVLIDYKALTIKFYKDMGSAMEEYFYNVLRGTEKVKGIWNAFKKFLHDYFIDIRNNILRKLAKEMSDAFVGWIGNVLGGFSGGSNGNFFTNLLGGIFPNRNSGGLVSNLAGSAISQGASSLGHNITKYLGLGGAVATVGSISAGAGASGAISAGAGIGGIGAGIGGGISAGASTAGATSTGSSGIFSSLGKYFSGSNILSTLGTGALTYGLIKYGGKIISGAGHLVSDAWHGVKHLATNAWHGIKHAATSIWHGITGLFHHHKKKYPPLDEYINNVNKQISENPVYYGDADNAFELLLGGIKEYFKNAGETFTSNHESILRDAYKRAKMKYPNDAHRAMIAFYNEEKDSVNRTKYSYRLMHEKMRDLMGATQIYNKVNGYVIPLPKQYFDFIKDTAGGKTVSLEDMFRTSMKLAGDYTAMNHEAVNDVFMNTLLKTHRNEMINHPYSEYSNIMGLIDKQSTLKNEGKYSLFYKTFKTLMNYFRNVIKGFIVPQGTYVMHDLIDSNPFVRHHSGGYLLNDEYHAILQKGEVVIPKSVVKDIVNGNTPTINKSENRNTTINIKYDREHVDEVFELLNILKMHYGAVKINY